ncbi:MAG: hypothetical protein WCO96_02285 [Actinomycetes bacterium]
MTKRGFYSVVAHRDDPSRVLVRARCERDIQALDDLIPGAEPQHTPDADYAWRFECQAEQWAAAVTVMAGEIDYPNFKAAITDKAHHRAYLDVWHSLLPLTDSVAEEEDRVMIDLAANPRFTYDPGDEDETTLTFIEGKGKAEDEGEDHRG